jgi:hydrogenase maturation protease
MARVTIIGYGNQLRGDDGLGWYAASALAGKARRDRRAGRLIAGIPVADLKVMALQQLAPELAEEIACSELVIFIDASCRHPPGQWDREVVKPRGMPRTVTHHLTPSYLLAFAGALYGKCPQRAFLLSAGGESFGYEEGLSPTLTKILPELEIQLAACLQDLSCLNKTDGVEKDDDHRHRGNEADQK